MLYSRMERQAQSEDDAPDRPFTLPLDGLTKLAPKAKRVDEALSGDVGMLLTVMIATWGLLGLLAYTGMFGFGP